VRLPVELHGRDIPQDRLSGSAEHKGHRNCKLPLEELLHRVLQARYRQSTFSLIQSQLPRLATHCALLALHRKSPGALIRAFVRESSSGTAHFPQHIEKGNVRDDTSTIQPLGVLTVTARVIERHGESRSCSLARRRMRSEQALEQDGVIRAVDEFEASTAVHT
jgi:hypothetical protein